MNEKRVNANGGERIERAGALLKNELVITVNLYYHTFLTNLAV